jgi:hypothetical protein
MKGHAACGGYRTSSEIGLFGVISERSSEFRPGLGGGSVLEHLPSTDSSFSSTRNKPRRKELRLKQQLCIQTSFKKSKWILATQEAEIRRIMIQSQPGQIVHKTLS